MNKSDSFKFISSAGAGKNSSAADVIDDLSLNPDDGSVQVGLLLPAVQAAREAESIEDSSAFADLFLG